MTPWSASIATCSSRWWSARSSRSSATTRAWCITGASSGSAPSRTPTNWLTRPMSSSRCARRRSWRRPWARKIARRGGAARPTAFNRRCSRIPTGRWCAMGVSSNAAMSLARWRTTRPGSPASAPDVPLKTERAHRLMPDASMALPIALGIVPARSERGPPHA